MQDENSRCGGSKKLYNTDKLGNGQRVDNAYLRPFFCGLCPKLQGEVDSDDREGELIMRVVIPHLRIETSSSRREETRECKGFD